MNILIIILQPIKNSYLKSINYKKILQWQIVKFFTIVNTKKKKK